MFLDLKENVQQDFDSGDSVKDPAYDHIQEDHHSDSDNEQEKNGSDESNFENNEEHGQPMHKILKRKVGKRVKIDRFYEIRDIISEPVSYKVYSQTIDKLGLKFKKPINDTCNNCDIFHNHINISKTADARKKYENLLAAHHTEAETAYESKKLDKLKLPGHTHMECDVDHATIKIFKKKCLFTIHVPRDWYNLVRSARTKRTTTAKQKHKIEETNPTEKISLRRRDFIVNCISEITPKYEYKNEGSNRSKNFAFHFVVNGAKVRVCKHFFVSTLSISTTMVRTALKELNTEGMVKSDTRGRHGHQKSTSTAILKVIRQLIELIARIESHYLGAKTSREYIDGSLNLATLYRLYKKM
ncbi:unnamed protein product [Diabrotica balteata]|uniref:Uncharacterized protein n=1 Tax=Diabrotica balteata TaxID=107213 RepID=A0A9N9T5U3_DIABA|nr:unnamed protein product [Diabrotica balteata]